MSVVREHHLESNEYMQLGRKAIIIVSLKHGHQNCKVMEGLEEVRGRHFLTAAARGTHY